MAVPTVLIDTSATRTSTAGIAGIDSDNSNPALQRLVATELEQLSERPVMQLPAYIFASFHPLADVLQVLEHEHLTWSEAIDDAPTDNMVQVPHPPGFPSAKPFQDALRAFRAPGLKGPPPFPVTAPNVSCLTTGKTQSVRRGSDVSKAKVDTNRIVAGWFRTLNPDANIEEELTVPVLQPCCRFFAGQKPPPGSPRL